MKGVVTSSIAADHNPVEHEETSILDGQGSKSMATEWTDEKHSLYLKSMEVSFVSQLYDSNHLLDWRSQENCSSNPIFSARIPSGQLKVLRGGCWENVSPKRSELLVNKVDRLCVLSANPWIRHFRCRSKHRIVSSSDLQVKADAANTESTSLPVLDTNVPHQDLIEMSDQNFVDEEVVRKKSSRTSSSTKRIKTSPLATSGHDQVVPYSKSTTSTAKNVSVNHILPKT